MVSSNHRDDWSTLITNPFSSKLSLGVIYGVAAALTGAALSIILRKLGKSDSPFTVTLIHNFAGAFIVSLAGAIIFPSKLVFSYDINIWHLLVILGLLASFLQLSVTFAYKYADAVVVTTLRYLQLPVAGLVGIFIIFLNYQHLLSVLGACAIFISSMVIVWREFVRQTKSNTEEENYQYK